MAQTPASDTPFRLPVVPAATHEATHIGIEDLPFVDLGDRSSEYARLLGLTPFADGGILALRGLTTDGDLSSVLALFLSVPVAGLVGSARLALGVHRPAEVGWGYLLGFVCPFLGLRFAELIA